VGHRHRHSAGQLKAIFEEFHQLDNPARERNRGLGLGLSIVQRISDLLGHTIEVHSWPDRGVGLRHRGAARREQAAATERSEADGGAHGPTGAILIVEDDPAVREMLAILFEGEGHRTTALAGTNEALALAARGALLPDVIIADYNLPGELTGAEVIARLRESLAPRNTGHHPDRRHIERYLAQDSPCGLRASQQAGRTRNADAADPGLPRREATAEVR